MLVATEEAFFAAPFGGAAWSTFSKLEVGDKTMTSPSHLLFIAVVPVLVVGLGLAEKADMNDRFAIEKFDPPANGFEKTRTTQQGSIEILKVQVHSLGGDREYEVVVTVGVEGETDFDPDVIVESGPILANKGGHFTLKNFDVGDFDPGTYRVDILVMPPGDGIDREFLLACQPAPFVTVE